MAVFSVQAENTDQAENTKITQYPAGWTCYDPTNSDFAYSASTDVPEGSTGRYSFKISRLTEGSGEIYITSETKFDVNPNATQYLLRGSFKSTKKDDFASGKKILPMLVQYDAEGTYLGVTVYNNLDTSKYPEGEWFNAGFRLPAENLKEGCTQFAIRFFLGGTQVNDYYIDDITLQEVGGNGYYDIPNADFETLTYDCNVNTSVAGTGGTISDSVIVEPGSDPVVTITPDAGYYISSIKVDGAETEPDAGKLPHEVNTLTLADISGDKTVVVTFALILKQQVGAQVRTGTSAADTTSGIRFVAEVSNGFLSKLPEDATVKMGFLCTPASLAGDAFDPAATDSSDLSVPSWNDALTPETEGDKVFSGAIYGIPENKYDYDLAARAYIEVNGAKIYANFNATDNVRNIKEVAESALADQSAPEYADWQTALLKKYAGQN